MLQDITDIRLRLVPGAWPVDTDMRERVDRHWNERIAANPNLWNGRVLGTLAPGRPGGLAVEDGILTGEAVEGDFAAFLAWKDWGCPEIGIRNLFGSALVLSSDGALIYGVMAGTTANAGRIYPPGGSLEPRDARPDGSIDLIGSIERELGEETGLSAADARCDGMLIAFDGPRISVGRLLRYAAPAGELIETIMAELDRQEERELAEVVAVRSPADLDRPGVPGFARAFAETLLAG